MNDEIQRDTSDPKQVNRAIKSAKARDTELQEALRSIMSSEPGRRWIHALLQKCGPFINPFRTDPLMMAFNCGEMNIGQQLLTELHACSTELYLQMMKENEDG